MNPMAAILAFACAVDIDWTVPDCIGWLLYDFAEATIIPVPARHATSVKRGRRSDTLSGAVHEKVTSNHVEEFCVYSKSRKTAEAMWARYGADDADLEAILSLAKQRVFL